MGFPPKSFIFVLGIFHYKASILGDLHLGYTTRWEVSIAMGVPSNGWFIQGKNNPKWMMTGRTSILGNHHIGDFFLKWLTWRTEMWKIVDMWKSWWKRGVSCLMLFDVVWCCLMLFEMSNIYIFWDMLSKHDWRCGKYGVGMICSDWARCLKDTLSI